MSSLPPEPARLGDFDAYAENLIAASRSLERELQARFAREYFHLLLGLDLTADQSFEAWQTILERRAELHQEKGAEISFRQALLEYFVHSPLLRDPVVTEFRELQRLRLNASTDFLTGIHNRRFFDATLERELPRAARYGHDLSLVVMDVNRFKEVNDLHGHVVGDRVLAIVGGMLRESVRASDYAFRIGGDEFALLLPQTVYPSAVVLAERVRGRFQESIVPLELKVRATLDYGVATSPREANDARALFTLADQRLYTFKRAVGGVRFELQRPDTYPRRFQRIPLDRFGTYAILRWNDDSHRAGLLDFSFGGVALRVAGGTELPASFAGDLYLPVLAPVSVWLRKIYVRPEEEGEQRVGCAIVEPAQA